jgi:hypothetical protein
MLQDNPPPPPGPSNEWVEVLKLARELQVAVEEYCARKSGPTHF